MVGIASLTHPDRDRAETGRGDNHGGRIAAGGGTCPRPVLWGKSRHSKWLFSRIEANVG